jgi:hypothetical protein
MPNYRRAFVPGGCWFFTVNLLERKRALLVDHIDALRGAVALTRRDYPFEIGAVVVLYKGGLAEGVTRRIARTSRQSELADYAALIRPTGC